MLGCKFFKVLDRESFGSCKIHIFKAGTALNFLFNPHPEVHRWYFRVEEPHNQLKTWDPPFLEPVRADFGSCGGDLQKFNPDSNVKWMP